MAPLRAALTIALILAAGHRAPLSVQTDADQADQRTPEGRYVIDYGNRASAYHLSLHISYPAPRDIEAARAAGRPAGGQIFVHGQPNEFQRFGVDGDWTDGCIALTNQEIEELWGLVGDGTPIDIQP